ncbi:cytochrome c3 family protein [Thermodesulfobacteriota bacterium]
MRKLCNILFFVVSATLFLAGSVFAAGVMGTPHDVTGLVTDKAVCEVCHIPHKSLGKRLWFQSMSALIEGGIVGELCRSCHDSGKGGGYTGQLVQAGYATKSAYAGTAHGLASNFYTEDGAGNDELGPGGSNAPGLPYCSDNDPIDVARGTAGNEIQCTSCHNVHDNATNRPFLRVSIRDLCVRCHPTRHMQGGPAGALPNSPASNLTITTWGLGNTGVDNPGSHPVGTDITSDVSLGGSPILPWNDTTTWTAGSYDAADYVFAMLPFDHSTGVQDIAYDDTFGRWNLGRHVVDNTADGNGVPGTGNLITEGVVCVSCHAVHGVVDDSDANNPLVHPNVNLLAITQTEMNDTGSKSVMANGNGDPANYLCESCHNPGDTIGFSIIENDTTPYVGKNFPNPGGTSYSHPMDDAQIVNELVTDFPGNPAGVGGPTVNGHWPAGAGVAGAGVPSPICESCHIPHPAWAAKMGRTNEVVLPLNDPSVVDGAGAGQYILRDDATNVCNGCHFTSDFNHHPMGPMPPGVGAALLTTNHSTPWTSVEIGANGRIGDGDNDLECGDCHSEPGAHNWVNANSIGMDPDWMPVNNGRPLGNDTIAAEFAMSDRQSDTCELCHYMLRSPGTFTVQTPTATETYAFRDKVSQYPEFAGRAADDDFQRLGTATHFLGSVDTTTTDAAVKGWTAGLVHDGSAAGVAGEVSGFDPRDTAWPNGNTKATGAGTAWSRWDSAGGANPGEHLVCESCHELEPDKNAFNSKLLVYFFAEDVTNPQIGRSDDNSANSYFCEGCHGDNGPDGTHPLTGDTVTRTDAPLTTDIIASALLGVAGGGGSPLGAPNRTPTIVGGVEGTSTFPNFANTTDMNCDSCHQVHDANTTGATYIIEAPEGNVTDGSNIVNRGGLNHPQGTSNAEYSGFCDQCHEYTTNTGNAY